MKNYITEGKKQFGTGKYYMLGLSLGPFTEGGGNYAMLPEKNALFLKKMLDFLKKCFISKKTTSDSI